MGWSLQLKWLWAQKTAPGRPWAGLEIPIHPHARALFDISIITQVGNGRSTLFWSDRWLHDCSLGDIAPEVVASVPQRVIKTRTVEQALHNLQWVRDISAGLSLVGLIEYLVLWDLVSGFSLSDEMDQHRWRHDSFGVFTAKSAYRQFFQGSITFEPWRRIWKTWAPPKCKTFLWLATKDKCWTADNLRKRGLPHLDKCVLCDQEDETVQHVLVGCVFAREFWYKLFTMFGLQSIAPNNDVDTFANWWHNTSRRVAKENRKGVNMLIILGAWSL
ncbi:hypothetical protein PR202_ga31105 [Eleusine coracana subsp. coracana]|uniref:Reverse transcriptase zinc-binding domain-containing protein n=1 Tax=Eleusine coracana subsp. coracana TaxID=191504 RepID=A0AAV5DPA1_ELECO|nr:hypothetical protein PR202_ga31105 [Eleusine coracana subsp. coracana]